MMINERHMYSNFALIHRLLLFECLEQGSKISFSLKYYFVFYRLLAVLVNKILIFSFPNQCQLLHTIETRENPKGLFFYQSKASLIILSGLCELSSNDGSLLVFPVNSKAKGGFIQLLVSRKDTHTSLID